MTDDQGDDELTRRFKAVFNKEPVSKGHTETTWKAQELDEYEIDDEEVRSCIMNDLLMATLAGKVGGGKCCPESPGDR
jgi:hypothetical protein